MHLIIFKTYKLKSTLYKNFKNVKRHKIKDRSDMFRIVCDPSSGSIKLYFGV